MGRAWPKKVAALSISACAMSKSSWTWEIDQVVDFGITDLKMYGVNKKVEHRFTVAFSSFYPGLSRNWLEVVQVSLLVSGGQLAEQGPAAVHQVRALLEHAGGQHEEPNNFGNGAHWKKYGQADGRKTTNLEEFGYRWNLAWKNGLDSGCWLWFWKNRQLNLWWGKLERNSNRCKSDPTGSMPN